MHDFYIILLIRCRNAWMDLKMSDLGPWPFTKLRNSKTETAELTYIWMRIICYAHGNMRHFINSNGEADKLFLQNLQIMFLVEQGVRGWVETQ